MVTETLAPETLVLVQEGFEDEDPVRSTVTLAEVEAAYQNGTLYPEDEARILTELRAALAKGESYYMPDGPFTYSLAAAQ